VSASQAGKLNAITAAQHPDGPNATARTVALLRNCSLARAWLWWGAPTATARISSRFGASRRRTCATLWMSLRLHLLAKVYLPAETEFLDRYPGDEWADIVCKLYLNSM